MTKLIIQIPCFNEEETLAQTLNDLPQVIDGIDEIETIIIDDGSSDRTVEIARQAGATHIISNGVNLGLAKSFERGLDEALRRGADIIVNTDGDNQYCGADVAKLVEPILAEVADVVIGDRRTHAIEHFSPLKKVLQKTGSEVVGRLADARIADAVSGFRAFSRASALGLTVRSSFSYTTETIIQAGKKRQRIKSVPIRTNKVERPSRLFRSMPQFLVRSGSTMVRAYAMYEPLRIFLVFGIILMLLGAVPIARFLLDYFAGGGAGKIQSLLLGGVLFLMGGLSAMFALIADLISFNRQLIELTLERVRKIEYALDAEASPHKKNKFPAKKLRDELTALSVRIRR